MKSVADKNSLSLDAIDLRILEQLQQDAALSNQALAEKVHVSSATCLRRVKRLTDAGLIERQVAILSPQHLGHGLTAILEITLDHQALEHLVAFETRAAADASVQQCYRVSPGPDFVLIVQLADMADYNAFVQRMLSLDANVRNVRTFFATHRAKFGTQVVLPAL
ncbi:Lrp/AsnC family transcriptional regulator [Uliginosibacterium sp. H3]|uniref:Lrp/AsnC family transcriptional regulator n=1 Tax=Uliginosibacterium silvisoli TaxID=3114758 RepID=A0ABU6K0V8_9RHOO|nr:Lrp/AsnC family transcriptional regulator [Uliginosibacterium sp. H3]